MRVNVTVELTLRPVPAAAPAATPAAPAPPPAVTVEAPPGVRVSVVVERPPPDPSTAKRGNV